MKRTGIVKEMANCIEQVTDFDHVVDTVLRERRFQASKRIHLESERAYAAMQRAMQKAKHVSL